jgi:hypothetical protein
MYSGEVDNKYISLSWKLGLHPTILALLSSITSNFEKWVPNWPLYHQEDRKLHIIVIKGGTMYNVERLTTNILVFLEN